MNKDITKDKFKTNKFAQKIKNYNLACSEKAQTALENAEQVKSWKRSTNDFSHVYVLFIGFVIGLAIAEIVATPLIISNCN